MIFLIMLRKFDLVFNALHGGDGENGKIQKNFSMKIILSLLVLMQMLLN